MPALAAQSNPLPPNRSFGRYTIDAWLAKGGMAELYLAHYEGLGGFHKQVVLKRILPEHARNSDYVEMFLDEARLVAQLQHPNIAQVYDVGVIGDSDYYFAMEYIRGRDVRQLRKRLKGLGLRLPVEHALAIAMAVASALDAAHQLRDREGSPLGIVHRDVSPSNIVVGFDGYVKLIDFGIAKSIDRNAETRTGVLKGKTCHMSPEQCLSRPLDHRSDLFCLGIVLYELTTGHKCFTGETDYETMRRIVARDFIRPSERVHDYPEALEEIVMWALERDPDDRYQSGRQLYLDLERFVRDTQLPTSPVGLAAFMARAFEETGEGATVALAAKDYAVAEMLAELDSGPSKPSADASRLARKPPRAASAPADANAGDSLEYSLELELPTAALRVRRPTTGEPAPTEIEGERQRWFDSWR